MIKREGSRIIINKEGFAKIKQGLCPICNKPKSEWERRKDWRCCSPECTKKFEAYFIIRSWAELRLSAFRRDCFKCVKCGYVAPIKKVEGYVGEDAWVRGILEKYYGIIDYYKKEYVNGQENLCVNAYDDSYLIGDHIIPIAIGGDEWDINNIQTLCIPCNKIKTAEDFKKIAQQRAIEKKQIGNSQLFAKEDLGVKQ